MAKGGGIGGRPGSSGSRVARNAGRQAVRQTTSSLVHGHNQFDDAFYKAHGDFGARRIDPRLRRGERWLDDEDANAVLGARMDFVNRFKIGTVQLNNDQLRNLKRLMLRDLKRKYKNPIKSKRPNKMTQEIKRERDKIASWAVRDEYMEISDGNALFSKNGIYSALSPGQNGLLNLYAGPRLQRDFMAGVPRDRAIRNALNEHPDMEEAIGPTIKDLADFGQRIRDGIDWANNQAFSDDQ